MKMKDKKMYASPRCTLAPLRSARVGQQRISGSLLPSLDPYFTPLRSAKHQIYANVRRHISKPLLKNKERVINFINFNEGK